LWGYAVAQQNLFSKLQTDEQKIVIAGMGYALVKQHFFKKLQMCNAAVLPSSCGNANADMIKPVHAHLWVVHETGARVAK
jgi:hypothetical protein